MNQLTVINATEFFSRPTYIYAMGDIKFDRPISLKYAGYLLAFIMGWTIPIFLLMGLQLNPFYLMFMLVPPFILASFSTKPIFGGKPLVEFANTVADFASEPKGWLDGNSSNMKEDAFTIASEIWVGRRRELQILADLVEGKAVIKDESEDLTPDNILRVNNAAYV